jgi:hypothetical protein
LFECYHNHRKIRYIQGVINKTSVSVSSLCDGIKIKTP